MPVHPAEEGPIPMSTHRCRHLLVVATLLLLVVPQTGCRAKRQGPPPDRHRLVLFLVADQFRYDYLERFRPLLSGGIGWMLDHGVSFRDAHHRHFRTATGPGHATLASGCHPTRHGIVDNSWFDRRSGQEVYCVEDARHGSSPELMEASTLGDWLAERSPESRIFAAAGKDRAAILMGGHRADAAYWYDRESGRFVTSGYYRRSRAEWLQEFHDPPWVDRYFGTLWTPLQARADLDELGIVSLDRGLFEREFPHTLGRPAVAPGESFYRAIYDSPYLDAYLGRLARELIVREGLGDDDRVDLLALGFSALDTVGHDFGPHSRETLDTLLRLDRVLGELLEFVDERIGLDRVIVTFSSDHGIPPLPEFLESEGREGHRFDAEETLCFQRVWRHLQETYGRGRWVREGLYLDHAALAARGVEPETVADTIARELRECSAVEEVFTRSELESPTGAGELRRAYANNVYPNRSPDLFVHMKAGMFRGSPMGTTHGTAHAYDTWVPLVVVAPGIAPRTVDEPVDTVDLAPTLASLLGIEVPETVDGVDLSSGWRRGESR